MASSSASRMLFPSNPHTATAHQIDHTQPMTSGAVAICASPTSSVSQRQERPNTEASIVPTPGRNTLRMKMMRASQDETDLGSAALHMMSELGRGVEMGGWVDCQRRSD